MPVKGQQPMIRKLLVFVTLSIVAISASSFARLTHSASQEPCTQDHQVWVADTLVKMETIKPGMTREQLLKVFTTEGGYGTSGDAPGAFAVRGGHDLQCRSGRTGLPDCLGGLARGGREELDRRELPQQEAQLGTHGAAWARGPRGARSRLRSVLT